MDYSLKRGTNLLYTSVFNNEDDFNILKLIICIIKLFSNLEGIDFTVFTSKEFKHKILKFMNILDININIIIINNISNFNIIEHIDTNAYLKVLHLDVDVIVNGMLLDFFNLNTTDYTVPIVNNFIEESTKINKFQRVKNYMKHILDSYKDIIKGYTTQVTAILRKQYTWASGRIVFEKDGLLITSWSRTGSYEFLNSHIVKASWSGIEHILLFNNTYTSFISIITHDISIGDMHIIDNNLLTTVPNYDMSTRNLLYFCVFHNQKYYELLEILLTTMVKSTNFNNIDLLVLTSKEFEPTVKRFSEKFNLNIFIHICDFKSQHEAGCARLFIYDFEMINEYKKILYMDCDIVVQGDLSKLFALELEEKVYAKKEYAIGGEGHGGWFFDFNVFDEKMDAINSGVLLFPNCEKIRKIFNNIRGHIANLRKTATQLPLCMDQSFIIYHLFINNACDNEILNKYIYLAEFTQPPVLTDDSLLLSHFVWPIGNTGHKKNRMLDHLSKLNELYKNVEKSIKAVIILTMTVQVGRKSVLHQVNPEERKNLYINRIRQWLKNTQFNIIIVENSGYTFEEYSEEFSQYSNRLEIISYNEYTLDESRYLVNITDKGSSELFAINYAYKKSKLIQRSDYIIKITGRYYIPELEEYLKGFNLDSYDGIRQFNTTNRHTARCELIGCHPKNFASIFKSLRDTVNLERVPVEHDYYDRFLQYNNVLVCKEFTIEPTITGSLGTIVNTI